MKSVFSKFNTNWLAVALLCAAFIYSAFRFYATTQELAQGTGEDEQKILRITHWQLEPGFREALEWVIDEYNALPEVKAAKVRVMQAPVPQRVYNQFMNVHLISGTAADIAVKGGTELIKGSALAQFYAPLGSYIETPNPYNASQYLSPNLSEETAEFLENAPWRDTFFDGLLGGYDNNLSDYYGIPICATGGVRLFYNLDILQKVKAFTLEQSTAASDPAWLQKLWRSPNNQDGYIPRASGIAWLKNNSIPQSLGQFYLYCYAVEEYAKATNNDHLVPISGSSYPQNDVADEYKESFLASLNPDIARKPDAIEVLAAYESGEWSFESVQFQEFFNLVEATSQFYPRGYLGLDREQAQRRFVLGMAAVIRTGGWDASSILAGISKRDRVEDQFEVEIAPAPYPAENERWADLVKMRLSEADARGVAPFAINKQSPYFDWALDFLRFATSHRINQEFSKRAEWLPVTIGANPPESIAAFSPIVEGFPVHLGMNFMARYSSATPPSMKNAWTINFNLFATGDLTREEMVENLEATFENPNLGIPKAWAIRYQKASDGSRAYNRSAVVEKLSSMLGNEAAAQREKATLFSILTNDEGIMVKRIWQESHPNEPIPIN
ncbi:MAG: hypothetical protein CML13_05925 [Puniceicoccaceae bacterium]|nr:hypothetical protein [Puniceicoccaceae bacterium]|tara:strand:- start:142 stop:1980 length:1839 start_codon:yes stop_codon:yes gene_type:complete